MHNLFLTFPAISITKDEKTNETSIDRFDINAIATNICAINELSTPYVDTPDAIAVVHFDPKCGLRPILTSTPADTLTETMAATNPDMVTLISFKACAIGKKLDGTDVTTSYNVNVNPEMVVAVNSLDGTTQQITDDVQTIIYFQPACGMQPILSPQSAAYVMQVITEEYSY